MSAPLTPERTAQALAYLDAVDRLNNAEARRISGLTDLRRRVMNVLAHRASPPEYPGLALVPVSDLDALDAEWQRLHPARSADSGLRKAAEDVVLQEGRQRLGPGFATVPKNALDALRDTLAE